MQTTTNESQKGPHEKGSAFEMPKLQQLIVSGEPVPDWKFLPSPFRWFVPRRPCWPSKSQLELETTKAFYAYTTP